MNVKNKVGLGLALVVLFLSACKKNDVQGKVDDPNKEFKHLAVMVTDQADKTVSLVWPTLKKVETFQAAFANGTPYTTQSGRFAAISHRANNFLETFDLGLEWHVDHVDWAGTPKFGKMTGVAALPTHFKSKYGEFMTFNDGDGTLSIGKEADIHNNGATMKTLDLGLTKHHGAMASFANGTYAVTQKDNSIPSTLPERVIVVNNAGSTLHVSTIQTKGIHGNATDGVHAVFGSGSGILVVKADGSQKLIPHPTDFGTAWFGTILETATSGEFIGYTAAKGAYKINVITSTVTPIIERTGIMQVKMSYDNKELAVLLHSGELNIFKTKENKLITSFNAIDATETTAPLKPQMVVTKKFAYISQPDKGELVQVSLHSKQVLHKFKLSPKALRVTILGYESDEDHN